MPDELRQFAQSSNGDRWILARYGLTLAAYVVHRANEPSGGAVTNSDPVSFLAQGPVAPEHKAFAEVNGDAG